LRLEQLFDPQFHRFQSFFIAVSLLSSSFRLNLLMISGLHLRRKEQSMKNITNVSLVVLGLAGLAGTGILGFAGVADTDDNNRNNLIVDVACDCRTGVSPQGDSRGTVFIIQGKIFPQGTLPQGTASNDPTQPVRGVAPIGDWLCRGQNTFPLPASAPAVYNSTPFAFNTQYFIFKENRALTVEGYDVPNGGFLTVTGGIGSFRGAAGDLQATIFGTNATGCPNFRAKFNLRGN